MEKRLIFLVANRIKMRKIFFIYVILLLSAAATSGQDLPQLKVTERDMTGRIFTCASNNETVVQIQSNVRLDFETNMDNAISYCGKREREENGFFWYDVKFPTNTEYKKYDGRKLTISSIGFEDYIYPLDLKSKVSVGLLVTRLADGLYYAGNYGEALKEYEKLRTVNPKDDFIVERIADCKAQISASTTHGTTNIAPGTESNTAAPLIKAPDNTTNNQTPPQPEKTPDSTPTTPQPEIAAPDKTPDSNSVNRNGEAYNPDGIELIYVEGNGKVKGFYIGKYEVTQAQWENVMGKNPSKFKGDNLPVENVSRNDAQRFLSRLNELTGRNYRLPTEVEWEFAARGGTANSLCPDGCIYSGSNKIGNVAWYNQNSNKRTHPVGTKQPNELGIYDMSGNVWEWCGRAGNAIYTNIDTFRGGGWNHNEKKSRVTGRGAADYQLSSKNVGFRVVLP